MTHNRAETEEERILRLIEIGGPWTDSDAQDYLIDAVTMGVMPEHYARDIMRRVLLITRADQVQEDAHNRLAHLLDGIDEDDYGQAMAELEESEQYEATEWQIVSTWTNTGGYQIKKRDANERYNGWSNYWTWAVALYIDNDEGLQEIAKECDDYAEFIAYMHECDSWEVDDIRWSDPVINHAELDAMIQEMKDSD